MPLVRRRFILIIVVDSYLSSVFLFKLSRSNIFHRRDLQRVSFASGGTLSGLVSCFPLKLKHESTLRFINLESEILLLDRNLEFPFPRSATAFLCNPL